MLISSSPFHAYIFLDQLPGSSLIIPLPQKPSLYAPTSLYHPSPLRWVPPPGPTPPRSSPCVCAPRPSLSPPPRTGCSTLLWHGLHLPCWPTSSGRHTSSLGRSTSQPASISSSASPRPPS